MALLSLGGSWAQRVRSGAASAYGQAASELTVRRLRERGGTRRFERVVVVGPLRKANGIAAGARLQADFLRDAGYDVQLLDASRALRNPFASVPHRPGTAYIFHCGAPQTAKLIGAGLPWAAKAWRIGYWAWELPDPAPDWRGHDRHLHEIWTPSAFSAASLRGITDLPIAVVPHRMPARPARERAPGPFTVLAMADSRSSFARKNPSGALRAFKKAFGERTDRRLLLKISGRPEEMAALEAELAPQAGANVILLKGFFADEALDRLYDGADVLLSLHRAEGFGLPMLEAMARGVPVIATGWSGSREFTDGGNAVLISYRLVPVQDSAGIYRGSVWAEPDLDEAAAHLRLLADDPLRREHLSVRARRSVAEFYETASFPPELAGAGQAGAADIARHSA